MAINPPTQFELSPGELESPTWRHLKKYLQARKDALRNELESDLPEVETAKKRGALKELSRLLSLDKQNPPPA